MAGRTRKNLSKRNHNSHLDKGLDKLSTLHEENENQVANVFDKPLSRKDSLSKLENPSAVKPPPAVLSPDYGCEASSNLAMKGPAVAKPPKSTRAANSSMLPGNLPKGLSF